MNPRLYRSRLRFMAEPASGDPTPGAGTPPAEQTPAPADDPKAGDQPKDDDEPLREPGKRALEAERAARAQAERDLAALRQEIADSKKTAEEKAADDLKAAQRLAEENATKALRYEVAAAKGLDLAFAARLTGSTKAELEADADALMALIPKKDEPSPDDGRPHTPYRELSRNRADAPTPSPGIGTLREAYAEPKK